jgi:putative flippase GtrA
LLRKKDLALNRNTIKDATTRQFARYLAAGGANTAFGYGIYASLNWLLAGRFPYSYLAASIIANIIAITLAYINYKFFVFRTQGNYLREYLRFYVVYGLSMALGLLLLPLLVELAGINSYLAGALLLPISVAASFIGHRHYSFRSALDASARF